MKKGGRGADPIEDKQHWEKESLKRLGRPLHIVWNEAEERSTSVASKSPGNGDHRRREHTPKKNHKTHKKGKRVWCSKKNKKVMKRDGR